MEIALALLAVSLVMFAVFVLLVVRGVRAARRALRRAGREVRRTVTEAALTARAAQPGPVGEVARTRRELRAALEGARSTLRAGADRDPALREALALLGQLDDHAERLDGELASLMTGEPDRLRIAERLPALRGRAERIGASARSLRIAAQDRAHHDNAQGLDALHRQIAIEADSLRHWRPVEPGPAERRPGVERPAERPRRAVED
ncbi:hypothetical protein RM780_10990 [Streptomyces sp. DSM 44917]|uniref:Secreted protein n=1 Tax=Streptomyces boetiae TaxID=3075541 RepID=A0ABU2L7E1_9ACTN|nr:hypothetical protein [Streptomyces sp. DSM 44917]MDT0307487.1 hypothetical protein [Streptomyces sp. DSM 44917]